MPFRTTNHTLRTRECGDRWKGRNRLKASFDPGDGVWGVRTHDGCRDEGWGWLGEWHVVSCLRVGWVPGGFEATWSVVFSYASTGVCCVGMPMVRQTYNTAVTQSVVLFPSLLLVLSLSLHFSLCPSLISSSISPWLSLSLCICVCLHVHVHARLIITYHWEHTFVAFHTSCCFETTAKDQHKHSKVNSKVGQVFKSKIGFLLIVESSL